MFIAAQFSVAEDAVLAQRWRRIMQVCNALLYSTCQSIESSI